MSTAVLRVKRALALAQLDAPANLERAFTVPPTRSGTGRLRRAISSHPATQARARATVARPAPGAATPASSATARGVRRVLVMRKSRKVLSGVGRHARGSAVTRVPARRALPRCTRSRSVRTTRRSTGRRSSSPTASSARTSFRSRLLRVLERAHVAQRRQGRARPGRAARAHQRRVAQRARAREPRARRSHFENVLYDKGEIAALLDFEFARAGLPTSTSRSSSASARTPAARVGRLRADRQPRRLPQRAPLDPRGYPELFENPRSSRG
jgi:hypothetical protein